MRGPGLRLRGVDGRRAAWRRARRPDAQADAGANGRRAAGAVRAAFWCEELGTYALALDGRKRPCRVSTSNPGHCLFTGIVHRARARQVADTLMSPTRSAGGACAPSPGRARYNPMSYHNGSVWPHDNAIVAAGLARYGFTSDACAF